MDRLLEVMKEGTLKGRELMLNCEKWRVTGDSEIATNGVLEEIGFIIRFPRRREFWCRNRKGKHHRCRVTIESSLA